MLGALEECRQLSPVILEKAYQCGVKKNQIRVEIAMLAKKFDHDFGACIELLRLGYLGPCRVLMRICWENTVQIALICSLNTDEANEVGSKLRQYQNADEKLLLNRQIQRLESELVSKLPKDISELIRGEKLSQEEIETLRTQKEDNDVKHLKVGVSFDKMLPTLVNRLNEKHDVDVSVLLTLFVDYWYLSGAVHSRLPSLATYEIPQPSDDVVILALRECPSLRSALSHVQTSLISMFELEHEMAMPLKLQQLRDVTSRVRAFLVTLDSED